MRLLGSTLVLASALGLTGCIVETPPRRPPPAVVYERGPPPPPLDYDHRPPPPEYRGPPRY